MKRYGVVGIGSAALVIAGFLIPFWPLSAVGVVFAVFSGFPGLALVSGAVLDVVWGTPGGFAGWLLFPFTLLALFCIGVRAASRRYVLYRDDLGDVY